MKCMRTGIAISSAGLMLIALVSTAGAQATPRTVAPKLDTVVVEATITDLQRGMSEGRFTALALTRTYLARIRAYDQQGLGLNAMVRVNPAAERDAMAMDAERRPVIEPIDLLVLDTETGGDPT